MELHGELHKDKGIPIYVQLVEQIRFMIHRGDLAPGAAMPTVRALAVQLTINANTVARVYRLLQDEGLLNLKRGLGTFVAEKNQAKPKRDLRKIEKKADELIALSRDVGLSTVELFGLLELRWEEAGHVNRQRKRD